MFEAVDDLVHALAGGGAVTGDGITECADIDECARKLDMCREASVCMNSEGSFSCPCADGYADATRLGIDVDLTVSGPTIRARVTQIFRNPTQNWVEATYVYPLP